MTRSRFDLELFESKLKKLEEKQDCSAWLVPVLKRLGDNVSAFPAEEDERRYTVEYVYPH